jgi:hypothetical protein
MPCPSTDFNGEQISNHRFTNWLGNVSTTSEFHFEPADAASLVKVVADASASGRRLRPVGRGWSFEAICSANSASDWTISLARLQAFLDDLVSGDTSALTDIWRERGSPEAVNRRPLVCVEAGIKLIDLNRGLADRGLALASMGGSQGQFLAGAISTSTHGGDIDLPPLPDVVRAVHLVTSAGREIWVESHTDPLTTDERLRPHLRCPDTEIIRDDELLSAVQVSLGCFGVIYAYVLEVRPAFALYEEGATRDWSEVASLLTAALESADPLLPLLNALPAPSHNAVIGDPSRPRFMEILISSRSTHECHIRRRWESSEEVAAAEPEGGHGEWYCIHTGSAWILKVAASILRLMAQGYHTVPPPVGTVWAIQAEAKAAELDVMALLNPRGATAVAAASNAIWSHDHFHAFGHVVDELSNGQTSGYVAQRSDRVGSSWQIMASTEEGGGDCERVNSLEIVFPANTATYVEYITWLMNAGHGYRQAGYISIRFGSPSKSLLSMHNFVAPHVVSIEVASVVGFDGNTAWMIAAEARAVEFGGRPHWGQQNTLDYLRVVRLYGRSLFRWKNALARILGPGNFQFINAYAMERGLFAESLWRRVTAVRREGGRITHLLNPLEGWEVTVEMAMEEIQARSGISYFISPDLETEGRSLFVRHILTTAPDDSTANNLDSRPHRPRYPSGPLETGPRQVTSVEKNPVGDVLYLNNDIERWSVSRWIAAAEIEAGVREYFIETDGVRTPLIARRYLTTYPDGRSDNNLSSLPEVE